MIVTCHQPHFLPWIPYFNKLAHSKLFIVLDDVDYRKGYYQNRTRILAAHNTLWLTIPIGRVHLRTPISQVLVSTSSRALNISVNRLREVYRAYIDSEFLKTVLEVLHRPPANLIDLNMLLIDLVLRELRFNHLEILPISRIVGRKPRDERVLTALKEVGATRVIVGMGGMATAHNLSRWQKAGIEPYFQHPQNSPGHSSLANGNGISVLHDVLTVGPTEAASIVKHFWVP